MILKKYREGDMYSKRGEMKSNLSLSQSCIGCILYVALWVCNVLDRRLVHAEAMTVVMATTVEVVIQAVMNPHRVAIRNGGALLRIVVPRSEAEMSTASRWACPVAPWGRAQEEAIGAAWAARAAFAALGSPSGTISSVEELLTLDIWGVKEDHPCVPPLNT